MRPLQKNLRTIHYSIFNPDTNEFSTPIAKEVSVSGGRSSADADYFGLNVQMTNTITVAGEIEGLNEGSLIWYGRDPTEANGIPVHESANYYVSAIPVKALNHTFYAINLLAGR